MGTIERVLCIVSSMDAGGAETFLMKLYRNLDRDKYQMDFCVNNEKSGLYDDEIRQLGGKIYVIPCKSENFLKFKRNLADVVSKNGYKYVLRITSNGMGFWDLKIAKESGAVRCVARSSNSSDGNSMKVKIAHLLGRALYQKYVDIKIAPSDLAARYTFGKKTYEKGLVYILHNALDTELFKYSDEKREQIRRELEIEEETILIGHIGRFTKQKNHDFLLQIFAEILEKNNNALLMLVGDGELKDSIQIKGCELGITDKIIYMGVRKDIPEILAGMDVFVFPSLYEGMPNTVIEAQAAALPCIIADTITNEANITGLVKYKSLNDSPREWAEEIINAVPDRRKDVLSDFKNAGYEIGDVTRNFEQIIFH